MDEKLLKETYKEYVERTDEILEEYGEKDGFLISGAPWWEVYKKYIDRILSLYEKGDLSEGDLAEFYVNFGFGIKLHGKSFIENGVDNVIETFKFLKNEDIPIEERILKTIDEPESPYNLKGVGINFVTLFLTVIFPHKYVQWNSPIGEALKILKATPEKPRGIKMSEFYKIINERIILISRLINEPFLPIIDNYLFCLSRGYIGKEAGVIDIIDETIMKLEEEERETKGGKKYLKTQYYLIMIGKRSGFDVWVAVNDREESYKGEKFSDLTLNKLPEFGPQRAISMAKWIDVIWFERGSTKPVRFFEIEHATSIFSGLLRLNDVFIDYPIPKATIVIPEVRFNKAEKEIDRPTFQKLSEVFDFLTYENVSDWYDATVTVEKFR